MSPDPVALRISRETYRSYHEIRLALNYLEWHLPEWTPEQREKFIENGARGNCDVYDLAQATIAAKQKAPK